MATIPAYIASDRYWKPVIHLFQNSAKLNTLFTTKYFDMENGLIEVTALKRAASKWSQSEKFLLYLAIHLYTNDGKMDLSVMDYLDEYNKKLALEAIKLRFF
ncbi:hypothetical protein [Cytobacillus firmus]|uniref:hypothetical protein n=1 Tax=Cytobacillus firmus TaxID=1399 RepID=UPI0018CE278C|nr:hypothetical protein [Cytobacillus firmus]MBG9657847.1 hypothetical protein [Cytobacillus firmus]MED1904854.1 hypothetical protein [Cytobacillus firmus]